ncbi:4-hydroxy-tetrahydrodipicolinate synthase [Sporosarcina cascadiensis]|uniref:4-hydroxy-tetrahydrodipicolinate synthase n=1 Tax=Sporosarcina cascadiensis TaxID=2660747 RepID=UPI00129C0AC4|nr:4-hydroxy-tetrahydrodipicolinate synthase [Sporosarcina cascadiensis]
MLSGIVPALLTPLTETHEINENVTRQLVRRLVDKGVHGLFTLGTNGEFFTLSQDEKVKLASIIVDEVNGQVPVAVGTGGNSTREVIELSKRMEDVGADVLSIITPYFDPPSQQELIAHYEKIAEGTNLPIILYNIPSRTGVSLSPDTVKHLSKVPSIKGVKDSSGNFDNILQYINLTDDDFTVMSGTDSLIYWTLLAGGSGAVAATANVFPDIALSIYDNWKKDDHIKAMQAQEALRDIRNLSTKATVPAVYKKMLELQGVPVGPPRAPVMEAELSLTKEIQNTLDQYKERGWGI